MRTFAVLLLLLLPTTVLAQRITGIVVDTAGAIVPGASVTLRAEPERTPTTLLTDSAGRFAVRLRRDGTVTIAVQALGYAVSTPLRVTVGTGEEVNITLRLVVQPVPLAELTVESRRPLDLISPGLIGFHDRKEWGERLGIGRFVTEADALLRNAGEMTHVLSQLGVRLFASRDPVRPNAIGISMSRDETCRPALFLDGVRVRQMVPVNDLVPPAAVYAVEVYRFAELPPEFAGVHSTCGAIAIWTRRR